MNDMDPQRIAPDEPLSLPDEAVVPTSRVEVHGRKTAKGPILGALVVGGIAGAAILGPLSAAAASPTATPAAPTSAASTTTTTDTDADHAGGPGGPGHTEAVTDTSVVAKAIGISEADLQTALDGGQTVAAVAKAHGVALQTVIDALVADGTSELAAQVAKGSITEAQADADKAEVLQRATDQANGTFSGGRP